MKLPTYDKLLHLLAGIYIYLFASLFLSPLFAILVVVVIGAGKEILWDKLLCKGCFELNDFFATLVGGLTILILTIYGK